MIKKILDKLTVLSVPICFLLFILLNYMFSLLYCGEVSTLSWKFSVFWAVLFCGILTLLPTIGRRIGIVFLVTFFALSCIVHAVMYNLFGNFFAFSDLLYTEDGLAFFSFAYVKARKLLWITAIGSIVASFVLAFIQKKQRYRIRQAIIGIILVVVGVIGINTHHKGIMSGLSTTLSWDVAGQNENDADIYQGMTNKNYVMSMTGIYQYLYRSFMVTSGWENKLSNGEMYKELDEYFEQKRQTVHETNEMTSLFEGKNVFFIMLESIDTWILTEEFMPNLYRLQQDSINFVNHYSPLFISAGTFNTEFIANTSLIPPSTGIDNKVYKDNYFPNSIANIFNEVGYTSNSFHSSNPHIYNRGSIHENLGYNKYHNWVEMGMENYMLDSQMINGYSKMVENEPFLSFIITYSGHGPYTEELHDISDKHINKAREMVARNPIDASENDTNEYTYAIAHAMETDAFIGSLTKQLQTDGMLEDTVLVFFADHYGKYMTNHELVMELKGAKNADFLSNTPFFIYHEGTEAQVIETITSTIDIVPTVANMFGLDVEYEYYTGVDAFSEDEHYAMFPGNSWYDGEVYYSPSYEGEMTEKIKSRNRENSIRLKMSEYVLKSNYFKYLQE